MRDEAASVKPLKEKVFRYSFGIFIIGNLILELINFMYSNKLIINKDKYKCMVIDKETRPVFYFKHTNSTTISCGNLNT